MRARVLIVSGISLMALIVAGGLWLVNTNLPPVDNTSNSKGGLIYLSPEPVVTGRPSGPAVPTPMPSSDTQGGLAQASLAVSPSQTYPGSDLVAPTPVFTTSPVLPRFIIPYKIKIPSISIDTFVERVGVASDGSMDTPKNIWNTAWFGNGGYKPGERGNAVIAGHLDAPGTKAIFWDLDKIKPGAQIYLSDTGGRELTFEVTSLKDYLVAEAPLAQIFGPSTEPHLNLITCSGVFSRASHLYNKRLVVFTKLAS